MKILITGATGFVGSRLVARLADSGHFLRLLVRDSSRLPRDSRVEVVHGHLDGTPLSPGLGEGIGGILHLAGALFPRRRGEFMKVNRDGTRALARACAKSCPEAAWIQVSSIAATGPGNPVLDTTPPTPVSLYGRSKLAGEEVAQQDFPGRVTILRPPTVYGPGDRALLPWFQLVRRGLPCPIPALPSAALSFIHVDDLVGAMLATLDSGTANSIHHVAGPEVVPLAQFPARIGQALGRSAHCLPLAPWFLRGAAAALAPMRVCTGWPPSFSVDKIREATAGSWVCDPAAAEGALGWRAKIGLDEGLVETARSYGLLSPNA